MICANLKCENIFATKWTYSHLWDLFLDLPNNHWHNITPWQDCIESVCVCGGGGGAYCVVWWPMWGRNLHVRPSSSLFTTQYQPPEPTKAASYVAIVFKWLKSLISWCWYVQKGMGDEVGCVNTQLFSLDVYWDVGTKWWQLLVPGTVSPNWY